jgi:hypothetical protein
MTDPESPLEDRSVLELAQALMAEITGRLEDLAGLAADSQLASAPRPDLVEGLRSALLLAEAHRELLSSAPAPCASPPV